jgi:hypothetical protein
MIEIPHKYSHQNYDRAFKEALALFENQTLDFLGLNLPRITRVLPTEFAEIETKDDLVDLLFWLEDRSVLHIEGQTALSEDDLYRFARYDLKIINRYRVPVHTVVLSPFFARDGGMRGFTMGSLSYSVHHVVIHDRNADEVLLRVREELLAGRPISELELIFIPLMKSRLSIPDLLLETIQLEKEIIDENIQSKVIALTLAVSNKLVEPELLDRIWKEVAMLNIFKYAEEKGEEKGEKKGIAIGLVKGREQGLERGRIEEKRRLVEKLLVKKIGMLPKDILDQIHHMDSTVLDLLSDEILDIQNVEELREFMHNMKVP